MRRFFLPAGILLLWAANVFASEGVSKDEVRALLGEVYMIEKDYPAAVQKYRAVLERDPANVKVRTQLADVLSWQKQYDEAIAEYLKVLEARPDDFEVKKKLAGVYTWVKDYSKAQALYQELIARGPGEAKETVSLAGVFVRLGKTEEAMRLLNGALARDPKDLDAKVLLADIYAEKKDFKKAVSLYQEALDQKYDRRVKAKMGDALSWARKYRDAFRIYDELLAEKDEKEVRLQKARILGWARKYRKATQEYRTILDRWPDELIEMELKAKRLYWNNRVKRAIRAYEDLILKAPDNVEAIFDLSQIYSYQSMWREAKEQYQSILGAFADHFRAKEGLKKAQLISGHPALTSGYEFFRARSGSRDMDIHKNTLTNRLHIPLNDRADLGFGYDLTRRSFSDFSDLTEHEARVSLDYRKGPDWSAGAFFNMVAYHKAVAPVYEFGEHIMFRLFDLAQMTVSHERQRLENNSEVIRKRSYRDDYQARVDLDLTKRLKAGTDYTFSYFSDSNICHEPAADVLYFLTLEPRAFYVKYRYFFRDFRKVKDDYFSPQDFSTHTISVRWRQFLNREEVFFGANDIYYEAGYDLSIDSTGIVSHKILGGLSWDITKRLQVRGEGQYTHASARVYEDAGGKASVNYYF